MSEEEVLREEIKRKDEIIAQLREENAVLMKMSLKSAGERAELKAKLEKLREAKEK